MLKDKTVRELVLTFLLDLASRDNKQPFYGVPASRILGHRLIVYHQPLCSVTFRGDCAQCNLAQ